MNKQRVIVLNDVSDVTEVVRNRILNNDLDILQVNYNCDYSSPSPFYNMDNLTEIKFEIKLGNNVQSLYEFFYNCKSLKAIPLFDTQRVTNMESMFAFCEALKSVPKFDTKNVKDMSYTFCGCNSLKTVPKFDTKNVTNMSFMFATCSSLKSVPQFDTQNCGNIGGMFAFCPVGI